MAHPPPDDDRDDEGSELEAELEVEAPDLARYRAETDRLRLLIDFLHRPPFAPTDAEGHPDPQMFAELTSAYVFAAQAVSRIAGATGLTATIL